MLLELGIPFRYEQALKTRSMGIVFPDFTLLDVWNRKIVLFEHFGLMDDESYRNRNISKIRNYIQEGFELGNSLLYTMETNGRPLSTKYLKKIIRNRFPHLDEP